MTKRKVVFFGNCQARQLSEVYRLHLAVDRDDQVFFANVQCVLTSKEEVIRALREADAVVSQIFDFPTKVDVETSAARVRQFSIGRRRVLLALREPSSCPYAERGDQSAVSRPIGGPFSQWPDY